MEDLRVLFNEILEEIEMGCLHKKYHIKLSKGDNIYYSELALGEGVEDGWKTIEVFSKKDYRKLLRVYSHYLENVQNMKGFFIDKRIEYLVDKFELEK